jgi:hypothetical protein
MTTALSAELEPGDSLIRLAEQTGLIDAASRHRECSWSRSCRIPTLTSLLRAAERQAKLHRALCAPRMTLH